MGEVDDVLTLSLGTRAGGEEEQEPESQGGGHAESCERRDADVAFIASPSPNFAALPIPPA